MNFVMFYILRRLQDIDIRCVAIKVYSVFKYNLFIMV
jgi:hypothetical protein